MKKLVVILFLSICLLAFSDFAYTQNINSNKVKNTLAAKNILKDRSMLSPLSDLITVLDYELTLEFDLEIGDLVYNTKVVYEYNPYGDVYEEIMYKYNENQEWSLDQKTIYEYNEERNVTVETHYNYENGDWVYSERYLHEYLPGTDLVSITYYQEYVDGEFVTKTKYENFYEGDKLKYYVVYSYSDTYKPTDKIVLTYENDLLMREDYYTYNELTSDWFLNSYRLYTYGDNQKESMIITYNYNGELQDYIINDKVEISYNENDDVIEMRFYTWNADFNEWLLYLKINRTYNIENYITEELITFNYEGMWIPIIKTLFFYKQISEVSEKDFTSNISIFPNPATDIAYLQLDEIPTTGVLIKIYDNSGKLVRVITQNATPNNIVEIDTKNLSAGNYFIIVFSNNLQKTVKLIKN